MIRVLVADDHPAFRRGVAQLLVGTAELEPVLEAATGTEAIALASSSQVDVVLMDLRMPDLDGFEATKIIRRLEPPPAVLVLTMLEDEESLFAAMRAGAHGYLLKGAGQDELVRAIRSAAAGEAIFGPGVAVRVLDHFRSDASADRTPLFPQLTLREREILELISAGKGNATIARELMITLKTVRNHVSNVFTKLQVPDRATAIATARAAGLSSGGPPSREGGGRSVPSSLRVR